MNKDKSIEIQKQVRDNTSDLQSEFLDMKNWEEEMKKKEELINSPDDTCQVLPPVRKKKSSRIKSKTKENGTKAKRIKAHDYSAWDNFDADKACEEIDKENESEDSGDEVFSKEELEKKHEEATIQKVLGNKYVTEKKWDKAMACYNEAIKIFPYDAVFYANRALCHLKMDNLYSAESDCTAAIQRDEHYVKAYHRRATARMALKQYAEAISDLKILLGLENNNKEAKKMLETALKCQSNLEKKTGGTSTLADTPLLEKKNNQDNIDDAKLIKDKITVDNKGGGKKVQVGDEKIENKIEEVENKREGLKLKESADVKNDKFRKWLPIIDENVDVVKPVIKLPHQRIKKPLKLIPVTVTDFTKWSSVDPETEKCRKVSKDTKSAVQDVAADKNKNTGTGTSTSAGSIESIKDKSDVDVIPAVPRTSVQFCITWRKHKSPEFRYKYLKQLPPDSIPKLFKDSMESDTFSEILTTLRTNFIANNDPVYDYLKYLSEIKRFRTLTMFLSKQEKEDLTTLFNYCKSIEGHTDTITDLRKKYEL